MTAIEAGAEDVEEQDGKLLVYTNPIELDVVRTKLTEAGLDVDSVELTFIPQNTITIDDEKTASTLMKMMDALDENDDVTATYANFDLTPEVEAAL
jgi:transcriptional/translational regulatory protein YebC/TACO1